MKPTPSKNSTIHTTFCLLKWLSESIHDAVPTSLTRIMALLKIKKRKGTMHDLRLTKAAPIESLVLRLGTYVVLAQNVCSEVYKSSFSFNTIQHSTSLNNSLSKTHGIHD
ncbi:hypothetical protein HBH71_224790 [Parastagonospora nodorum]|nr:hypothetical protein HBI74_217450 [Parastagonospora nodorum]KAH5101371.1 hypothetical protein HBH71_224790 [Parastagonospora nodorum]KAH5349819.1 hypothetical protein HBI33_218910 [Parastagonospora nodorum]KAH6288598.1 hypothetical protein HBI39_217140 [Parastagonospora nodorum]